MATAASGKGSLEIDPSALCDFGATGAAYQRRVQSLRALLFSELGDNHTSEKQPSNASHTSTSLALAPRPPSDSFQQRPKQPPAEGATATATTSMSQIVAVNAEDLRKKAEAAEAASAPSPTTAVSRPKWRIERVCVGHDGRVTSLAFDPSNAWFASGSADASIRAWDLVTGKCQATLTGHKAGVESVAVSKTSPYLFSAGLDKVAKCWDLERNAVIREYFGHLSAVYTVATHPSQDIIVTGGRDATVRVWDIRTCREAHVLKHKHTDSVFSVLTQGSMPQLISGGGDGLINLWDLGSGRVITTLTRHKKAVRALAAHPTENVLISAGADHVRKWKLPTGEFMQNLTSDTAAERPRWACAAISPRDVLAVGADEGGAMKLFDWSSGAAFQAGRTKSVAGTLPAETGVLAAAFDRSGTKLLTGEGDKTVKFWAEKKE